jgi:hypothetical protein
MDATMREKWRHVENAAQLADTVHEAVLMESPDFGK